MRIRLDRSLAAVVVGAALLGAAGCGGKKAPLPPAPMPTETTRSAPPAGPTSAAPTAMLLAEPSSILRGERARLRWSAEGATTARLSPGIGVVATEGTRDVSPSEDTVYTLVVEGPGGQATASARISLVGPPPGDGRSGVRSEDIAVPFDSAVGRIRDVYFGYDANDLSPEAQQILDENARILKDLFAMYPEGRVIVEGHCDERGTNEYNLALGDRRAQSVRDYLVGQGVPDQRMRLVSFGEERPQCFEANESCWSRNRRAHFTPMP